MEIKKPGNYLTTQIKENLQCTLTPGITGLLSSIFTASAAGFLNPPQLRDYYESLEALCTCRGLNRQKLLEKMDSIDYHYDEKTNQFI